MTSRYQHNILQVIINSIFSTIVLFQDILAKKEELNTLTEGKDKNKKQPVNIRDDFWLVTKKPACDKFFKELASLKPLSVMSKKVPIFNRNDDILDKLFEFEVPHTRGVWLIKMHAAYRAGMQEQNKSKKRGIMDPCSEWTQALTRYTLLLLLLPLPLRQVHPAEAGGAGRDREGVPGRGRPGRAGQHGGGAEA